MIYQVKGYTSIITQLQKSNGLILHYCDFITYHRVCNQINTTGVTRGARTDYLSGAHEFTPGIWWGSCYSIFSFICMFCRSMVVLFYFFRRPLCCLFFDIRILITPLVSSNSSQIMLNNIRVIPWRLILSVQEVGKGTTI